MSHEYSSHIHSAPYSPAPSHFSPSMADPNVQSRQQNVAYPSPHSYPSPSMQPTYTYPPPQGQQNEPYRESPQGSNMSLPPLNLPPIRLQDGQQPPAQSQPSQQPMGSPLPPPQHGLTQNYYHPAHAQPGQPMNMGNMGPAQFNAMRYQLPPNGGDQRVLSGGRHKKEIKRRTKTGWSDMSQKKNKGDATRPTPCAGTVKNQSASVLATIPSSSSKPAPPKYSPPPNSAPAPHSSTPAPAPAAIAAAPYGQSPVPQGYAPASSAGYAPAASATSSHPESFNAIDPALAQSNPSGYNGVHAMDPAMRGPPGANPYPPGPPADPVKGRRLNMADIFGICNHNPPEVPKRTTPMPQGLDEEFTAMFFNDYCQGLDVMLQTTWFSTNNNALNRVFADRDLHEEAAYFTETIRHNKTSNADMTSVFSQEARLIWHLLSTCKHASPATNGAAASANAFDQDDLALREVRARFDILQALLTNQNVESNPLRQISYPADIPEGKRSEVDFWLHLGDYVQHAGSEASSTGAVDHALATMRGVLLMQEVRDAIYSIAIARHYGNRIGGFPNALPAPVNQHPETDLSKLHVAMSFISHECRAATQQVLARICDMAMLSWTASRSP